MNLARASQQIDKLNRVLFSSQSVHWATPKSLRSKYCLSIHRVDETKGYSKGNIVAITLSLNNKLRYAPLPDYLKAELQEALQKAACLPEPDLSSSGDGDHQGSSSYTGSPVV